MAAFACARAWPHVLIWSRPENVRTCAHTALCQARMHAPGVHGLARVCKSIKSAHCCPMELKALSARPAGILKVGYAHATATLHGAPAVYTAHFHFPEFLRTHTLARTPLFSWTLFFKTKQNGNEPKLGRRDRSICADAHGRGHKARAHTNSRTGAQTKCTNVRSRSTAHIGN